MKWVFHRGLECGGTCLALRHEPTVSVMGTWVLYTTAHPLPPHRLKPSAVAGTAEPALAGAGAQCLRAVVKAEQT